MAVAFAADLDDLVLGVVPLAIATGAGAEMRRALGQAEFSGMLGVTLFGIFLTPVFFYVIRRFSRVPSPQQPTPEPPATLGGASVQELHIREGLSPHG
jgi:multidrug efflux pump